MNILLALVPLSAVLVGLAIWAFVWAVRRGQFDDLDTPALSILTDEDAPSTIEKRSQPVSDASMASKRESEPSSAVVDAPAKSRHAD